MQFQLHFVDVAVCPRVTDPAVAGGFCHRALGWIPISDAPLPVARLPHAAHGQALTIVYSWSAVALGVIDRPTYNPCFPHVPTTSQPCPLGPRRCAATTTHQRISAYERGEGVLILQANSFPAPFGDAPVAQQVPSGMGISAPKNRRAWRDPDQPGATEENGRTRACRVVPWSVELLVQQDVGPGRAVMPRCTRTAGRSCRLSLTGCSSAEENV